MHRSLLGAAFAAAWVVCGTALASTEAEIAELRAMVNAMKQEYEGRIRALEARLAAAEQRAQQRTAQPASAQRRGPPAPGSSAAVAPKAEKPAPGSTTTAQQAASAEPAAPGSIDAPPPRQGGYRAVGSGTAFNPQLSVILDGNYYHDDIDGAGAGLAGNAFQPSTAGLEHGHEEDGHGHGETDNGFNFREAEIAFSATVDPYFDATTYVSIDGDGNVDLEEAYFQTRSLPHGLKLKGGKFLSDFGYINRQHPHQWDFVDQNLPYLNLLGEHGLQDTGVQLTWLPDWPVYTLLGLELLQGDQERFGTTLGGDTQAALGLDDTRDGPRLWTAFAKLAPDLGYDHALQLGLSYARNDQHQEAHEELEEHAPGDEHETDAILTGLEGDADLWGLDLVYKYDGVGDRGHRDFKLQAEYLRVIKDTRVSSGDADLLGSALKFTTDGLYVQGTYGVWPRWNLGLRYDVLGLTNKARGADDRDFGTSDRWSVGLTWDPSEFSRLRLQYAWNDIWVTAQEKERFQAFYLQFLMSLGAHGAHTF